MARLLLSLLSFCILSIHANAQYITISAFRSRTVNDTLVKGEKIAGRVSAGTEFRNTSFIQDATGGIAVFNSNFHSAVQIGDSVEISGGQLQDFQAVSGQPKSGLSEIAGSQFVFTLIPAANTAPVAKISAIQSIGEGIEGMLVKVRSVTFTSTGSFQGDKNYFVKNANGDSVQVRIDANTEIAKNNLLIPNGAVDLIGCLSQFRGTYQIQPRFASDIGATIDIDTVGKDRTFDVTCWNVKQFMSSIDTTIKDKQRQLESVKRALDSIQADLVSLEEVANPEGFQRLVDTLAQKSEGRLATEILQDQKMGFIYRKDVVSVSGSGLAVNGGAQAWANGRFPLRLSFTATVNGQSKKMTAFSIHAKATGSGTETADLARRTTDAETFHEYLNNFYANEAVIVLGDFNDDVTTSVVGSGNPTPYKSFVDDATNWTAITKSLSEKGLASYLGSSGRMIDHIVVSNEVVPSVYRTKLETPQAFLSSYTSTVSDHVPVSTRLYLENIVVGVPEEKLLQGATLRIAPNPMHEQGMIEFVNEHAQHIDVEVLDMLGLSVSKLYSGYMPAEIRLFRLSTLELSPGMYTIRCQGESGTIVKSFIID